MLHWFTSYNRNVINKNNNAGIRRRFTMILQYQCACCNEVVSSTQKVCPKCGSQHIKSPYNLWIFCLAACFVVAITFKIGHVYVKNHQTETPTQVTLLDVLQQDSKQASQ